MASSRLHETNSHISAIFVFQQEIDSCKQPFDLLRIQLKFHTCLLKNASHYNLQLQQCFIYVLLAFWRTATPHRAYKLITQAYYVL